MISSLANIHFRLPLALSVATLLLTILLSGCARNSTSKAMPAASFRVMTYNIRHGEGLDGRVDLERIAQLIRQEGADIVALQEVERGSSRTGRRDMPAELARLTGMTCVFSNNFHFGGGDYGNAVLTRFPVKNWSNFHYPMLRPGEQRGLLQLELDVRGVGLVFLNTHADYNPKDDSERWAGLAEIEAVARRHAGKPAILCGDFNDTPASRTYQRLCKSYDDTWARVGRGDGFTVPAEAPTSRIDYLWISRGNSLKPLRAWVPQSDASDHRPVVAEFSLQ